MEQRRFDIVAYQDRHGDDFARLNREWLDRFELYEEADGKHLYSPREYILDLGGEIFIAEKGEHVVGTCALVPVSDKVFEVAKLAVSQESRGEGLGRRLTESALKRAWERGAMRVILYSSSKLGPALKLYESLGFKNKPVPSHQPYETADVYMECEVATAHSGAPPVVSQGA
jgi:GNAT superfamily N-acetyltransferase